MRSLVRSFDVIGEKAFEMFNEKNPSEQKWYHHTVLEYTKELENFTAYKEYKALFCHIFGAYETEEN